MLNYWWVTRPKRKLNSVPEVLSAVVENIFNQAWDGERKSHLQMEDVLENSGLKRVGDRRDGTGGGGRTYIAWLKSLGLLFVQENKKLQLTLAGEAIINGESPVKILTNQVLKYQYPSSFSISKNVDVNRRFKIHPFWFLLKLLTDNRIEYLTEEEIGKIIITEAENDTDKCYEYIVKRILEFRNVGNDCLQKDFPYIYKSSKSEPNLSDPYGALMDIANTIVNWLDYTQFISRSDKRIKLLEERKQEAISITSNALSFIPRAEEQEFFQRKYGLDTKHKKDTRNLSKTITVTSRMIDEIRIKKEFINISLKEPIGNITANLIERISEATGITPNFVEDVLEKYYPAGAASAFLSNYFEMAFKGREECREFEIATANIFTNIFGFHSKHIAGGAREVPDVLLFSDKSQYQAIIDTKAYHAYGLEATHRDRMIHHYIPTIKEYSDYNAPLAFFSYISGGFTNTIERPLNKIVEATGIPGSAMPISRFIKMIDQHSEKHYTHDDIKRIFSVNRKVSFEDLAR